MEAGQLDRKIVIQSQTVTRDAMGGESVTWGTYKTVWAGFKPIRNSEKVESGQLTATRLCEFTFRYQDAPAVDEAMQIVFESNTYEIEGIQFWGRQETIKAITKLKI
jgi:SPP1 family predicted phage head-tail adaptor